MACYYPITCYDLTGKRTEKGKAYIVFKRSEIDGPYTTMSIPCGRCIGCRLDKSREWATRCMAEQQTNEEKGLYSCFITLTYDDEHYNPSLNKEDFRDFMKRLRSFHKRWKWKPSKAEFQPRPVDETPSKIRYFHCGEYGDLKGRPHHHACIFGYDFPDKETLEVSESGHTLYTSLALEELWTNGLHSIGDLTWESAAYVARYTTKKVTGELAESYYTQVDEGTGEILRLVPEFCTMSRRPGIGREWLEKYGREVRVNDRITKGGKHNRVPRYFDKELDRTDPEALLEIKRKRISSAKEHEADNTLKRLRDRAKVKTAQVSTLRRNKL
jgi:hypothetical protein